MSIAPPTGQAPTRDIAVIRRAAGELTWGAAGDGLLECACHAVRDDDGRVWVFDPLDGIGLDVHLAKLGTVSGVIVLLDRHLRDSEAVAARHGVPLYFPAGPTSRELPDGTIRYSEAIPGCPFEFIDVRTRRGWLERAAWLASRDLLVVAESIGTVGYYKAGDTGTAAVHPMMRATPPEALRGVSPETVLVGHGPPITTDATAAVALAIDRSRRGIPGFIASLPGLALTWGKASKGGRAGC